MILHRTIASQPLVDERRLAQVMCVSSPKNSAVVQSNRSNISHFEAVHSLSGAPNATSLPETHPSPSENTIQIPYLACPPRQRLTSNGPIESARPPAARQTHALFTPGTSDRVLPFGTTAHIRIGAFLV